MNILPTAEQQEIADAIAAVIRHDYPLARLAAVDTEPVSDRERWPAYGELGWFGLGLPEQLGGVGCGAAEEVMAFRELGRHLGPLGVFAGSVAARLTAETADDALRARILAGEVIVGWAEEGLDATGDDLVLAGTDADLLLVHGPTGLGLVDTTRLELRDDTPDLDRQISVRYASLAATPRLAELSPGSAVEARATLLAAAMLAGIAEAGRDAAVSHATVREQFGVPIGSFQAVKHRCADMAVRAEAAWATVSYAAVLLDEKDDSAAALALAAKLTATDAAVRSAQESIQVHGGIGFTYEQGAHLYVRRAHVLDHVLGGRRRHLADFLAIPTLLP